MAGLENFSLSEDQRGFVGVSLTILEDESAPTPRPKLKPGRRNFFVNFVNELRWEMHESRSETTRTQIEMVEKDGDPSALIELMRKAERRERKVASLEGTPDAYNAAIGRADTALAIRRHVSRTAS